METEKSDWRQLLKGENLYYISFVYVLFLSFMRMTSFTPMISPNLMNRLTYLAVLVLLAKIYILDHAKWQDLVTDTVIIGLAVISWRKTLAIDILIFILFILAAKGVNFRSLIKLFFGVSIILLIFTILFSQMGVIKDMVYRRGHFYRHSLGVNYPTDLASHTLYLIWAYCYLRFDKINWRSYLSIAVIGVLVFIITNARTSFALTLLTIPIIYIAQRAHTGKKISHVLASFYWIFPAVLSYLTILTAYFYKGSMRPLALLNKILSGRLVLSYQALHDHGMTLFGQPVLEHGYGGMQGFKLFHHGMEKYFYIDSSFTRLAVIYGLIIGCFLIFVMTRIAYKSTKYKDYCLAAIMLLIAIHCIIEQHLLDIAYNPFLIALLASHAYRTGKDYKDIKEENNVNSAIK